MVRPAEGEGAVTMAFSPKSPADYQTVGHLKKIGYRP
jgi:hypothetical protein